MTALRDLLAAAGLGAVEADKGEATVTGVTADSRAAGPGSVFVAVTGQHVDGHVHAAAAAAAGAVAVVAERLPQPALTGGVPVVIVSNARVALSALAAAWYGHPSRALTVAGVTGTDGKTTTSTMLWAAWQAAGMHAGLVSTVDFRDGSTVTANATRLTTMEAMDTQARLAALRQSGCSHVALEASSHALHMHRVDDAGFRVAVYTRITSEHLDVHGTREGYLAAKARLLGMVGARGDGVAVLDADDDFAYPRLSAMPVASRLSYSVAGRPADLTASGVTSRPDGVGFVASTPWGRSEVRLRLAGRFNAANALAAIGAACATGASLGSAVDGIGALERVDGRMERVDGGDVTVVIDYAHTAEALDTVLTELRSAGTGRLWVVFGSAGERDTEKRAAMGAVAARRADVVVVTDEDPRGEDRLAICEQIAAGAEAAGARRGDTLVVIPERGDAIAHAIGHAAAGDTVLCAGKGHESSIIQGRVAVPWSERAAVEAALRAREPGSAPGA